MHKETVTIQQAIRRGELVMSVPAMFVVALAVLLFVYFFFNSQLLLAFSALPVSIFFVWVYSAFVTPHWRIWAYSNVADIHQLQRSAEISGLLKRNTATRTGGIMGAKALYQLGELMQRFEEEQVFVDDSSIPSRTDVSRATFFKSSHEVLFTLCDDGIEDMNGKLLTWDNIWNARVAMTGTRRYVYGFQPESSGYGPDHFRFETEYGNTDYLTSSLNIEAWKLDLLLYIYRGRYEAKRNNPQH